MEIILSNQSRDPIYLQITKQIKTEILSGRLAEGEALPSMRLLAKELKISMITTKRAYEELEKEGFIYTVRGKGCFVAARNPRLVKENRLKEIESLINRAVEKAVLYKVSFEDLERMLRILYKGE